MIKERLLGTVMTHTGVNCFRATLLRDDEGQSLIEIAVMMTILVSLMGHAINFGYFFIAAANI